MLRVLMLTSGVEVLALTPEECDELLPEGQKLIRHLKVHLETVTGQPRFRQRLLCGENILDDAKPLEVPVVLHLVLLSLFGPSGDTLDKLGVALQSDDVEFVNSFLQQPHDPDQDVDAGVTCLCLAANSGSLKSAKLLLEAKADVDKPDTRRRRAPLHWACVGGHAEFTRWLLQSGASVDKADALGMRLLHTACYNGHLEVARAFVESGADINAADSTGYTPLIVSAVSGDIDMVRFLVHTGADKDKASARGGTALSMACIGGQTEVARFLIEHGADNNQANEQGVTPLLRACFSGRINIVRLLLEAGTDVNQLSTLDVTPLHVACSRGRFEIARLLVHNQADLDAIVDGRTALDVAQISGHLDIVNLLTEAVGSRQVGREPKRRRRTKRLP